MAQHPKRIASPGQGFVYVGDKQLKKLQKTAWDAGWWPAEKKSGIMWLAPDGTGQVMLHATTSDTTHTPTPWPSSARPAWTPEWAWTPCG